MNFMKPAHSDVHERTVLKPMDAESGKREPAPMKKEAGIIAAVYVLLLLLGVGTGYLLSQKGTVADIAAPKGASINTGKVVGVKDASTFKDCADGKLEKGGLDGEGTHHLLREGGPSQTAYLISSIVDLDAYAGATVNVCGQTMAARKVSWLMDVGRLEVK